MKKLLIVIIFLASLGINAQFSYGIKAGINYNNFNDLNITGGSFGINEFIESNNSVGFHAGAFGQLNWTKFYVRTELLYIQNKGSYNTEFPNDSDFKLSTLELPVLLGFTIIKQVGIYVGPSLIYNLDTNFSDAFDLRFENTISVGFNIGASFIINKFGIDLRYSGGFSENTASYLDDIPLDGVGYTINTKPSQFLLSLSYTIN